MSKSITEYEIETVLGIIYEVAELTRYGRETFIHLHMLIVH